MMNQRLLTRRKELGLSQADLARAVGVSRASVNHWEKGNPAIKGENLIPLAKVLKCDINWLLNGQGSSAPEPKKSSVTTKDFFWMVPEDKDQPKSNEAPPKDATKQTPPASVALDFYDVEVSAGHGALIVQEEKKDCITFSREFIDNVIGVNSKNVFLMPVRGDSMTPTLKNQAIIMVNRIEDFSGDGIYVFRFDGQLMVKRLQFSKTGLTVVSDNREYKEWELTRKELATEDFEIIGQVVWSGQRM